MRHNRQTMPAYQTPECGSLDRKDHVWLRVPRGGWRCCLCGAFTGALLPPTYPTPSTWRPERYDVLTAEERGSDPGPDWKRG